MLHRSVHLAQEADALAVLASLRRQPRGGGQLADGRFSQGTQREQDAAKLRLQQQKCALSAASGVTNLAYGLLHDILPVSTSLLCQPSFVRHGSCSMIPPERGPAYTA